MPDKDEVLAASIGSHKPLDVLDKGVGLRLLCQLRDVDANLLCMCTVNRKFVIDSDLNI